MAGTVATALNSPTSEANLVSASKKIQNFISNYFSHPCDENSDNDFLGRPMNTTVKVYIYLVNFSLNRGR